MPDIRKYIQLSVLCMLFAPVLVNAADLASQLSRFFANNFKGSSNTVNVVVKTPEAQWPGCDNPLISLPGNARMWGNLSVSVSCNQDRRFIQVEVQVTGSYVVAAAPLSRGSELAAGDIRTVRGRIDQLPPRALFTLEEAQGAIALRDIAPGQAITQVMIRKPWVIRAGQNVQILAQGDGFSVRSEGKAMNNAASGQPARARTASGQVVSGIASGDGIILISQ
ncbi:flagellar basal body P-ring formation chaperone FlgA [Dickeya chrysanthemi]|uniref:Flagella basal body P-ring formation protein FlgA n=1 Tax=Dickeya chrysanthemi TaxID=556 RepID=A0ABU8JJH7_DICCH|nr:flagellar basal body P-ring formation chaperone FlgA [Dickeya chrysanthemi]MBX9444433.1 flagellar basal body P-ring formation protein FlgA [Dickeya chrysanthemi]MCA7006536.1 flagellar basal body P-ring formation protein FlgA [Dickeya chrysanthemi]